jgi:hypothetical protein
MTKATLADMATWRAEARLTAATDVAGAQFDQLADRLSALDDPAITDVGMSMADGQPTVAARIEAGGAAEAAALLAAIATAASGLEVAGLSAEREPVTGPASPV